MPATVTDAGPFEKLVEFELTEAEIQAGKAKAARRLSKDLKIRGFRPGKAPLPIVEATVGSDRLRSEAIDDVLPEKLGSVLGETDLEPAVTPQLENIENLADGIKVQVRVTTWPELGSIPEIHDREIEVDTPEVTDEELAAQIDRIRDQFAELEPAGRPATSGDYVTLSISATAGAEPVEEAGAESLLYEVGHGGFIDGIDEQLEGAEEGSTVTFDGTLPPGFGELAGKEVTYTITVSAIQSKKLPELTDEWVSDITEFDTVEEMRARLTAQMAEMKKRSILTGFREQALELLVEQVDLDLPDALVSAEMDEILHRFGHRLQEQGIEFDDYFRVTGVSQEQFVDDLRRQADRSIRTRLLLEAVADQEGLEVTEEELMAVVHAVAADSRSTPEGLREALRGTPQEKALTSDILRNKALDAIVSGARPVDKDGHEVDLTIDESVFEVDGEAVEGQIVEGEVLEGQIFEGEIVEGEIVETIEEVAAGDAEEE